MSGYLEALRQKNAEKNTPSPNCINRAKDFMQFAQSPPSAKKVGFSVEGAEAEAPEAEATITGTDTIAELDAAILRLAELEAWPPELLRDVQDARRRMRPCDVPGSLAEFRRLVADAEPPADDRRTCDQCANLIARRCTAAKRGEIVANRDYAPVRDIPRRCEGFEPGPDDPDRRPGRERWAHLIQNGGE